jgi:hypothetical protein
MDVASSADIFQEKMSELMYGLEFVRAHIDDLLVLTKNSFEDHLDKLELALTRLDEAGLKINAEKSFFGKHETEYLGFRMCRKGVRPINNKVTALLNIKAPNTKKKVRSFVGMINYYKQMWMHRSHMLTPLTRLQGQGVKFKWMNVEQTAFDNTKKIMAKETLLTYPDFNKTFHIHTDASKYQLGAVITQDERPIIFHSRKLSKAQCNYDTRDRESLSVVEVLKDIGASY